jgi:Zn-dependent protease with chaperone function
MTSLNQSQQIDKNNTVDTFETDVRMLSFVLLLAPFLIDGIANVSNFFGNISILPSWISEGPFWDWGFYLGRGLYYASLSFLALYLVLAYFLGSYFLKRKLKICSLEDLTAKSTQLVNRLSKTVGLKKPPKVYVVDNDGINCFVFGRSSTSANLVFTSGLLKTLSPSDIENVTLHELGHVLNKDMQFMTWGILCFRGLVIWFPIFSLTSLLAIVASHWFDLTVEKTFFGSAIIALKFLGIEMVVVFIFVILLPFLILNSVSRKRELLADQRAMLYLKNGKEMSYTLNNFAKAQFLYGMFKINSLNRLNFAFAFQDDRKKFSSHFKAISRFILSTHPTFKERTDSILKENDKKTNEDWKSLKKVNLILIGLSSLYLGLVIGNLLFYIFWAIPIYNTGLVSNYVWDFVNKASLIPVTSPIVVLILNIYTLRKIMHPSLFLKLLARNTVISYLSLFLLFLIITYLPIFLLNYFAH